MKEAILKTLINMVTEDREGNPILYAMDDDLKLLTNKLNEAINYTHSCTSEAEQLECECKANPKTIDNEIKNNKCFDCGLPIVAL